MIEGIIFWSMKNKIPAIAFASLLAACATPLPDHRCSEGAQIEAPHYYEARRTIDRACHRFAESTDRTIEKTDLSGVEITIREWRERTECQDRARGCARLLSEPQRIDVERDGWRTLLIHEVYHVLLWRARPDIHPDDHHRWLFEHRLCGPDGSICGYGLRGRP